MGGDDVEKVEEDDLRITGRGSDSLVKVFEH